MMGGIVDKSSTQLVARIERVSNQIVRLSQRFEALLKRWADRRAFARLAKLGRWRIVLLAVFLVAFFAPTLTIGAMAYKQYSDLRTWGLDGVHQLLAIKDLLPSSSTSSAQTGQQGSSGITDKAKDVLNPKTLNIIKQDCLAAQSDFEKIHTMLSQRQGVIGFAMITPLGAKVQDVEELSVVGIDAATLGAELATVGADFTNSFTTSPFSPEGGPILSQKSFADVQQAAQDTLVALQDMQRHHSRVNLNALPISAAQKAQLAKYLPYLPKAIKDIQAVQPYLPLAGWALGVDKQRTYLIQTMDRSELRPSGGFNGSWGLLNINGGRVGSISMTDVTFVDYSSENHAYGQLPPPQYQSWWPFWNWGLRDANLSGDFPTSANFAISTYAKEEAAPKPDGDIMFSPLVIEHLLRPEVLGPITIPCYNVIVTSTNLEATLHYFQLDPNGLAKQNQCSPNNHQTSLRKRFTSALASALEDKVRSAPQSKLIDILNSLRQDLVTKDLEVWIANPQIESLLSKDHLNAAMLRDSSIDSTYIVNADIGVNKGAQFLTTTTTEYVTLDQDGNAYHNLLIQLDYHPTGNVYGYSTYRDFIRVYTSPNAIFTGGTGFDRYTDPPLCYISSKPPKPPVKGGIPVDTPTAPCQPADAAACASGTFFPGQSPGGKSEGSSDTYIDDVGKPTLLTSDEPGRAMFGGLAVIPPFCKGAVVLSWLVPHIAGTSAHHNQPYTFVEQRQSGSVTEFVLQINPASGAKVSAIHDDLKQLTQDCTWTLGKKPASSCDATK